MSYIFNLCGMKPNYFTLSFLCSLLRGRDSDGFAEAPERMIRAMLKAFPFADSQLLHQMVRSLADVEIVSFSTGLLHDKCRT